MDNRFALFQCDGVLCNLLDGLTTENKTKVESFFNDNSTWASAVLQSMNERLQIMELLSPDTNTMVDLGAHIGLFSLFSEPFCNKIYSFEPSPIHFELLEILSRRSPKITPIHAAISNKSGSEVFYEDSVNKTQNSLIPHPDSARAMIVKSSTLPDFFFERKISDIDLLKIDIEGFEVPLILGESFADCSTKIKKVYVEVHNIDLGEFKNSGEENKRLIIDRLGHLGFKINFIHDMVLGSKQ